MEQRPLIVVLDDEAAHARAVADVAERGWRPPRGTAWPDGRSAFVGSICDPGVAAQALMAALDGYAVVVHLPSSDPGVATFIDDLGRIGPVDVRAGDGDDTLDADGRKLLRLLAEGQTVDTAARATHLSLRTAQRRLEHARRTLGVRSTAEAVRIAKARGLC
jgi:DNA-binding NarL/FixJ family response regulator